jgi:hypothetical protein
MDADHTIRFARVDFRNDDRVFGIKDEDRFLHVYVIGKTGTGKSTLIETMALQDLERGNGFALIDPHGDLVAGVAARISTKPPVSSSQITSPSNDCSNAARTARKICVGRCKKTFATVSATRRLAHRGKKPLLFNHLVGAGEE